MTRKRLQALLALLFLASTLLICPTVERSQAWADAEATRRAYDAEWFDYAGD